MKGVPLTADYLPWTKPQTPAWHEQRRAGIGGSDASTIMGFNPYESVMDLWMLKTGRTQPEDKPQSEAMFWGTTLEGVVADVLEARLQDEVDSSLYLRHPEGTLANKARPWLRANLDRLVFHEDGDAGKPVAGVEIKTAGTFAAKEWQDGVSAHALWQAVHCMAVTGLPKFYFGCLIAGQKFVWRELDRPADLIDTLIEAEEHFWGCVMLDEPPPVPVNDPNPALTRKALSRLWHEVDPDTAVDLSADMVDLIAERKTINDAIKALEKNRDALDSKVMEALGDKETGLIDGIPAVTWKVQTRKAIDQKALREEQADIAEKFTKTTSSRVLRMK